MSIVFYSAPLSSATPIACALAELGVPHEKVVLDLSRGDQKKPEFLRINPNGQVPALVVDGTPMFEALAIQLWLGEQYAVPKGLWPAAGHPDRLRALSFATWSYVTLAGAIQRRLYAMGPRVDPALHNAAQAKRFEKEIAGLLKVLDDRLASSPHLLGEAYGHLDLIVASVVGYGNATGISLDGRPHVERWLRQIQARPAFKSVVDAELSAAQPA